MKNCFRNVLLIAFGLFIACVLIEVGLRSAALTITTVKEIKNRSAISKHEDEYVILCLGESTTDRQWPLYLEETLAVKYPGKDFAVIDKGKAGTTTTALIKDVPGYLETYAPDMVIAMMGVNESIGDYEKIISPANDLQRRFLSLFKIVKLWQVLALRIHAMRDEAFWHRDKAWREKCLPDGPESFAGETQPLLRPVVNSDIERFRDNNDELFFLAQEYLLAQHYDEVDALLSDVHELDQQALVQDPRSIGLYTKLVAAYIGNNQIGRAKKVMQYANQLDPAHEFVLRLKADLCKYERKYDEAEDLLRDVLGKRENPYDVRALIDVLVLQDKYEEADRLLVQSRKEYPEIQPFFALAALDERFFERDAMAEHLRYRCRGIDVRHYLAVHKLAIYYNDKNEQEKFRALFPAEGAQELDELQQYNHYRLLLAQAYLHAGLADEAYDIYKRKHYLQAINENILAGMAMSHFLKGDYAPADSYFDELNQFRSQFMNKEVLANYYELIWLTQQAGIQLVSVQYPMRDVDQLKNVLSVASDVVFVDNELSFKEAVKREGYDAYFGDNFAIDFGHCTEKGNRLLARNIAETLSREVFGDR